MDFKLIFGIVKNGIDAVLKKTISAPSNHENKSLSTDTVITLPEVVWKCYVRINRVTSPFGWRTKPGSTERQFHNGTDYTGTNKYAVAPCACIIKEIVAHDPNYPYRFTYSLATKGFIPTTAPKGRAWTPYVKIQALHDSNLVFIYRHGECLCQVGQILEAGQQFYRIDNYGFSQGNHLHVEAIIKGKEVDPDKFIMEKLNVA